jgi:very-short-patch-repair endonuclease
MTESEARLWSHLRGKRAWKFRRQEPIDRFICDFVCYPKRLIVEVDGSQHEHSPDDAIRDGRLRELGFRVLRVWSYDVMSNLTAVLEEIDEALETQPDIHRNRAPRDAHDES